ncbi:glycoside hydrolase superfamily [Dactylonectria macrodidyma]|uniref:Beta-galactosidase n=1 Tax=Dactylonectria macrodidyma TaxID=307937 RepID=A0A9P9DVX0_9HYPO|nr:glycoside hydrolase superfamily [Dactylonectria macrodidyma]
MRNLSLVTLQFLATYAYGNDDWPVRDTESGDTTVQWDHYSLIINGDRVFSFGGEFHPFRIPVPEIWQDILDKIKAMGMNTMSFYNHWGFHAPSADVVDFETGAHDIGRLYEMCKNTGLYVHVRPGPYINGELSAGGMPLWATTGAYGTFRDNSTEWQAAWKPYMDAFDEITAPYQVSEGGPVILYQIENEFPRQWSNIAAKTPSPVPIAYMKQLWNSVRDNGIVVPLTHNMPRPQYKSWSVDYDTVGAGGNVHIYGLDNYPSCWSCISSDCSTSNPSFTLMDYMSHFNEVSPKQPSMMPEFQGGATNPWAGPVGGCLAKTDDRFVSLYYRDNIAQRVTILALYMIYGESSYDYSAAISENRTIGIKFNEIKTLGLFTRVAKDLTKTDLVGNSTSYSDNEAITTIVLKNPDTGSGFWYLRHTDPTSSSDEYFRLNFSTSAGNFIVPEAGGQLQLCGNYAKILVTDFRFGGNHMIYSTAEVLTYAFFDDKPTLVLWVFNQEGGEFLISDAGSGNVTSGSKDRVTFNATDNGLLVNFRNQTGQTVLELDNNLRVLLMDRDTAHIFWVPALTSDARVPEDKVVFVRGPHLVRGAVVDSNTLQLRGDSKEIVEIEIWTYDSINTVTWNGKKLRIRRTSAGSIKAKIGGPTAFETPTFGTWRVRDSLPERWANYSDLGVAWARANHTSTPNTKKDATKPFLYGDDYGFFHGIKLWRGRFNGSATGMQVRSQGGVTHGWTLFLNGEYVDSYKGTLSRAYSGNSVTFPEILLNEDGENIVLIVQDNAGHEQGSSAINPRGILNATLYDNEQGFTSWKVAGTAGGALNKEIDPVRTGYSQGGLTGERVGWHLPGYDDSDWPEGSPSEGLSAAGIKFYRTILPLDTPDGHDVSLSVRFNFDSSETSSNFRAYLYINGYQYGRYFPLFAKNRNTFPVPPGIWDYNGDNVVGVILWNQRQEIVKVDVDIQVNYVITSSLNVKFDGEYLRPGWDETRSDYA